MADLLAGGDIERGSAVVGGEVILGRETADVADLGEDPPGDDRADPEQPSQAGAAVLDHHGDLGADGSDLAVQRPDAAQVLDGQLAADLPGDVAGPDSGQDRGRLAGGELAAQATGGELGQEPVQPAHCLRPGRDQLVTPVAQQAQGDQRVIGGYRLHSGCLQGSQADGHGVVAVGLAAMAAGEHPDPRGQLRRHIDDWLTAGYQLLSQGPACSVAALDGPPPGPPLAGKAHQFLVARAAVGELRLVQHRAAGRIEHDQCVVGLMRVHRDQHAITHVTLLESREHAGGEEGNATSGRANLS